MNNNSNNKSHNNTELYIQLLQEKLESAMPEVHRQVRVYEERERSGNLTPPPTNNPLFGK